MAYATQNTIDRWLPHNGKTVQVDGQRYRLEVSTVQAVYPYRHTSLSVYARPLNRNSKVYRQIRAELGDDWSTDVRGSFDFECAVLERLEARNVSTA